MEKAFAYICASEEAAPRLLKRYCRKIYELGYVPICPALIEGQYLTMDNPDDKRDFQNISRQKLGRCRMLVAAAMRSPPPCPPRLARRKRGISSARLWRDLPKSRRPMDQRVSAGNGFASIAFGYPKAVPGRSPNPQKMKPR